MKIEGIDHVAVIVKDLDKAVQFFNRLFEMEFEEVEGSVERMGARVSISKPDGQIEFISVVDPVKAAQAPPPFDWIAKCAEKGLEGVQNLYLRVKDADGAAADAEKKEVRVSHILKERQLLDFMTPFTMIFYGEEDMPFNRITLIEKQ